MTLWGEHEYIVFEIHYYTLSYWQLHISVFVVKLHEVHFNISQKRYHFGS